MFSGHQEDHQEEALVVAIWLEIRKKEKMLCEKIQALKRYYQIASEIQALGLARISAIGTGCLFDQQGTAELGLWTEK